MPLGSTGLGGKVLDQIKAQAQAAQTAVAQLGTVAVTRSQMAQSALPAQARMRVERNVTPITLSTTWQRVIFNDPNPLNLNTFPTEASGKQTVSWDAANGLFLFNATEDRNYTVDIDVQLDVSSVITALLGSNVLRFQWRFVIPNGIGAGVPFTFPFPGSDGASGYAEAANAVGLMAAQRVSISRNIYATQIMRTNGLGIDLRLSGAPALGTVKASLATAQIYGR